MEWTVETHCYKWQVQTHLKVCSFQKRRIISHLPIALTQVQQTGGMISPSYLMDTDFQQGVSHESQPVPDHSEGHPISNH